MTWEEFLKKYTEMLADPAQKDQAAAFAAKFRGEDPLAVKNAELLGEKQTAQARLKEYTDLGLPVDKLKAAIEAERQAELGGMTPAKRLEALQNDWKTERETFTGRINSLQSTLREVTVAGKIRATLAPMIAVKGLDPKVAAVRLEDAVNRILPDALKGLKETGEGKDYKAEIDTTAGPVSVEAFTTTWSKGDAGKAYVVAPVSVGGGNHPVVPGGGQGDKPVSTRKDFGNDSTAKVKFIQEHGADAFKGLPLEPAAAT